MKARPLHLLLVSGLLAAQSLCAAPPVIPATPHLPPLPSAPRLPTAPPAPTPQPPPSEPQPLPPQTIPPLPGAPAAPTPQPPPSPPQPLPPQTIPPLPNTPVSPTPPPPQALRFYSAPPDASTVTTPPATPAPAANTGAMADLPLAVQKTLQFRFPGATVQSSARAEDHGRVIYELELAKDNVVRTIGISAGGAIQAVELSLEQTPPAVQKAVAAQTKGGMVDEILWNSDGEVTYDIGWTDAGGVERRFVVSEAGAVLSVSVNLDETPEPVRRAIHGHTIAGKIDSIEKLNQDGTVLYDVEWTNKAGQNRTFTVGEKGKVLSMEMSLDKVPAPVREAITRQLAGGTLVRIDHSLEGKKKRAHFFAVEALIKGQTTTFDLDEKGELITE